MIRADDLVSVFLFFSAQFNYIKLMMSRQINFQSYLRLVWAGI